MSPGLSTALGTIPSTPAKVCKYSTKVIIITVIWQILLIFWTLGLQIISREELAIKRKIGEGGFGSVALGSWRGTDCAIKQIRSIVTSGVEYEDLLKEAKIQL